MKIRALLVACLTLLLTFVSEAQVPTREDSLKGFDMKEMEHHLEHFKGTLAQRNARIAQAQRTYINRRYKLGAYDIKKLVLKANEEFNQRAAGNPNLQALNCNNIGFDNGTTAGWTTGGSTSPFATTMTTAGDIFITSGAGLDPYGHFPVVFSGTNSLLMSDSVNTSGNYTSSASRVLSVPPLTGTPIFFKLSFAVDILDYPHTQQAAAKFYVNFFDAAGNPLPCPNDSCYFYQNSANVGVDVGSSTFQTTWGSTTSYTGPGHNIGAQNFPVTYQPWQTLALDLTPYANTNVTCVVTCSWCLYSYDWAYCYIDAECPSAVTTNPGGTCGSLPLTLTGPSGMNSYSWTAPPGNNPATATTSTISAGITGTYTLNTTITTCSVEAFTFTYSVGGTLPTASFTDALAGTCTGVTSYTSTSTANGGPPISSYIWEWGDGTANGSGANATHNFATSGTQTVTLVVSNGSCADSIMGTVVIPPHPTANFTLANNCLNTVSNFSSTSTSSVAITTQNWEFGDATTGNGVAPNHTYGAAGTYSVTLAITDANSCTDSVTKAITIYPLPTITVNNPSICGGVQTATFTAAGASTYSWSPGLSATTGASVTGTPTVTTDYTVTGTDVNGCVSATTATISLNANPTITASSSTICLGQQTATLTAGGGVSYTWTPATLAPSTGSVVTGTPATTTQYTVTGANAGGCVGTTTTTITVNALPTITVNNSTICEGQQTATLTAGGAVTYAWNPSATLSSGTGNPVTGTPAVTTTYIVTGTDANGCVNTANSTITVLAASIVTVNNPTICVGEQTATLTANGAATYTWNPAATLSSNTGTTVTGTPLVTTSYTVTAANPSGCVSTATSTVTVNPLPVITVNSSTICVGQQTATLTANGAVTYAWNPTTGLAPTTGSLVTGTPGLTTNYTVTGTDANGCFSAATSTIMVNNLPTVIVNSSTICVGQQIATLSAAGAATYVWNPSATLSGSTGVTVTGTPTITTNYVVTGTDVNGCISTANSTILVHTLPPVAVNSSTICIGQETATLTATGAVTYTWNPATSLSSGTGSPVTGTPQATTNYIVIGTDANGCINTATSTITVNPLPVVSANTATICKGQGTATLTATGATFYSWNPSNTLSGSMGVSVVGSPVISTNYTVTGTDNNGCVNTTTTSIAVNSLPVIATSSITPTCVPLNATFSVTSNPAASSYVWNFGNGGSTSTTLNPSSSSFITNTTYTAAGTSVVNLTVTDINGCVSTATTIVIAYPVPVADFEYQPNPITILAPQVQFFNQSSGAIIASNNWTFGDNYTTIDTSSLVNSSHLYSAVGNYIVTLSVTSNYGCTATVSKPLTVIENYVIYVPNAFTPNGDGKNELFKAVGEGINSFKMYIFDRWGNNLFYSDDINQGWDGTYLAKGGKVVQEDVYVWKIDLVDFTNTNKSLHGTVTLVK